MMGPHNKTKHVRLSYSQEKCHFLSRILIGNNIQSEGMLETYGREEFLLEIQLNIAERNLKSILRRGGDILLRVKYL